LPNSVSEVFPTSGCKYLPPRSTLINPLLILAADPHYYIRLNNKPLSPVGTSISCLSTSKENYLITKFPKSMLCGSHDPTNSGIIPNPAFCALMTSRLFPLLLGCFPWTLLLNILYQVLLWKIWSQFILALEHWGLLCRSLWWGPTPVSIHWKVPVWNGDSI
jgi:hypothetical protein